MIQIHNLRCSLNLGWRFVCRERIGCMANQSAAFPSRPRGLKNDQGKKRRRKFIDFLQRREYGMSWSERVGELRGAAGVQYTHPANVNWNHIGFLINSQPEHSASIIISSLWESRPLTLAVPKNSSCWGIKYFIITKSHPVYWNGREKIIEGWCKNRPLNIHPYYSLL